jgi:hypothetical protein
MPVLTLSHPKHVPANRVLRVAIGRTAFMRTAANLLVVAVVLMLHSVHIAAQGSRVAAALEGSVKDSSGAAIAGAAVAVRNASTNQSRGMKTNEEGGFRAEALPVGTYEIPVNLSGFAPYRQAGFDLTLGETARLDIVLFPASLSEQVSVNAEQQAFDLSQASVVSPVDRERIEELPVQTRNSIENGLAALAEIVSSRIRANSRYCSVAYFPRIRIFQRFSHLLASRYT